MVILLSDLLKDANRTQSENVSYESDEVFISGCEYPISHKEPFSLTLKNDAGAKLLISGETEISVLLPCDRCLEPVETALELSIDWEFPIRDNSLVTEEDEIEFLAGNELDTQGLLFEEILMNWPAKVLCGPDCKGLCPVCGQNLNQRDCGCDRQTLDPRMAKFLDVFEQFKEV